MSVKTAYGGASALLRDYQEAQAQFPLQARYPLQASQYPCSR